MPLILQVPSSAPLYPSSLPCASLQSSVFSMSSLMVVGGQVSPNSARDSTSSNQAVLLRWSNNVTRQQTDEPDGGSDGRRLTRCKKGVRERGRIWMKGIIRRWSMSVEDTQKPNYLDKIDGDLKIREEKEMGEPWMQIISSDRCKHSTLLRL